MGRRGRPVDPVARLVGRSWNMHCNEGVPSLRRRVAVLAALALLVGVLVLPLASVHLVAPSDAAAVPPAPKFGARGLPMWANYDLASYPQTSGACGCEPTMGVDWVHGNGKDAMFQAGTRC